MKSDDFQRSTITLAYLVRCADDERATSGSDQARLLKMLIESLGYARGELCHFLER